MADIIVDVSYHNGVIDWSKVKAAGIEGAILRCGYGDNIASQDDKQYKRNADECTRLGIPWGVYIYSYAKNTAQARSEAEHVLRLVAPYKDKMSYPVFYDLEEKGTESVAVQNALVFGDIIENNGYMCGIYSGQSWWQKHIGNKLDRFPKWVARYNTQKPVGISGTYDIWQYTSGGKVNGINGRVDMNEVYRDFPSEIRGKKSTPIDGYVKENAGVLQDTNTEHLGETNYNVHARGIGWLPTVCDGMLAGSEGQNRRIEALRFDAKGNADVSVHMRGIGDKTYTNVTKDTVCGTVNEQRRIEAIKIVGKDCFYMYRVHQHKKGWTEWKNNGEWAGEKGKSLQLEAVEIKKSMFSVNAHMQTEGWLGEVAAENVIGITGKSKRLEAIKINPYGKDIKVKAHIQTDGWVDYGTVTKDTVIGTVGEGKRLEDLCFKGDFFFRVHLQDSGWTPWTKADGIATLGTVGQGIRIEAIQFK